MAGGSAQPWRSDRAWDPSGEPSAQERRARRVLFWGVVAAAVLLPWNALAAGRPDLLAPGVVLLADVVPLAILLRGAWLWSGWRRGGAVRLGFDRFPFFLGEPFEAVLALDPAAGGSGAVEVSLACLERRPDELSTRPAFLEVEVYRATQVVLAAAETDVTFELPGPEREIGTALGTPPARRWELRVQGRGGARVRATFPVPVYAPPADGEIVAG